MPGYMDQHLEFANGVRNFGRKNGRRCVYSRVELWEPYVIRRVKHCSVLRLGSIRQTVPPGIIVNHIKMVEFGCARFSLHVKIQKVQLMSKSLVWNDITILFPL